MADPASYTKGDWTNLVPAATKAKMDNIENGIKANNDALVAETDAGRALVEAADADAQRTLLNVEDGADVTDATNVQAALTADASGGRSALGLGDSATLDVGTGAGDVAAGNAPAGAVTAHESTYAHANLPTTNEKTRLGDIQAATGATTALKLANLVTAATSEQQGVVMLATIGVEAATKAVPATKLAVQALLAEAYDGVSWDESADSYVKLGRATSHPDYLKIQKGMRRCVVTDAGVVAYYLYPTNSALKEDGVTASVLDGTDGQVMVEIPKFYYSYSYVGTVHTWKVSEYQLPGFELHPLFLQGTTEMSKAYIGAYEASYYDVSASKYSSGAGVAAQAVTFAEATKTITCTATTAPFQNCVVGQKLVVTGTSSNNKTVTVATVADQAITVDEVLADETAASTTIAPEVDTTATTGDKLASISGIGPITNKTRAGFRAMATNRGTGWTLQTYDMVSAIQILYLVEYGSFYSQDKIGAGITGVTSGWPAYNNSFPIAKSGNSDVIGNATGNTAGATAAATEASKYLSYRGVENFFGHVWKWVDGLNINSNIAYKTNAITSFADGTATGYSVIGTLANADGWQNTLLPVKGGFLPKTVGETASGSVKITDYYFQASNWRVARLGGHSSYGASAGFFSWNCNTFSVDVAQYIGARLGLLKE